MPKQFQMDKAYNQMEEPKQVTLLHISIIDKVKGRHLTRRNTRTITRQTGTQSGTPCLFFFSITTLCLRLPKKLISCHIFKDVSIPKMRKTVSWMKGGIPSQLQANNKQMLGIFICCIIQQSINWSKYLLCIALVPLHHSVQHIINCNCFNLPPTPGITVSLWCDCNGIALDKSTGVNALKMHWRRD